MTDPENSFSSPINQVPPAVSDATPSQDYVPSQDERTLAMLAELLQLFTWIIGPLIIFLVKRESRFVRFHALQVIFWQLLVMLGYIVCFVGLILGVFVTASKAGGQTPGSSPFPIIAIISVYAVLGLLGLGTMAISIYFAVKAQSGAWSTYPLVGRAAKSMTGGQ